MVRMSSTWRLQRRTIHSPDWDDDETVTIRCWFGDHDKQLVSSSATEYRRDDTTNEMTIVATLHKLHATKRKLAVVGWTLKDDLGQPLAFNEENLTNLPSYVAEYIDSEVNKDWDNLGEPIASKEEADAKEEQERTDRATFHGPAPDSSNGREANLGTDDQARTGTRSIRRATSS